MRTHIFVWTRRAKISGLNTFVQDWIDELLTGNANYWKWNLTLDQRSDLCTRPPAPPNLPQQFLEADVQTIDY